MKTLAAIKKDLEFNKGLFALLEVLKTISVSQFRALEQKLKAFEKFPATIDEFFALIDTGQIDHPFLHPAKKRQIVVAITSDSGLLGGLNMQVVAAALNELETTPGKLVIIGERGKSYASESGVPFIAFSGIRDEQRHPQAMELRDYIIKKLAEEGIGYLKVVYPRPVSFTVQRVETASFLPYMPSDKQKQAMAGPVDDVIMESTPRDLLEYLVYLWMGHKFYELFGLSRLAEFAARFVHLEQSTERLKEMDAKMKLEYFRVRHEIIDRNMRELFSARLLYASTH